MSIGIGIGSDVYWYGIGSDVYWYWYREWYLLVPV